MNLKNKSFRLKLWIYFSLFAIIILLSLWILQTVFLQSFYNNMTIKNVKHAAEEIVLQQYSPELENVIDNLTYENSLLIFLTDTQGKILYSSDEHNNLYKKSQNPYSLDDINQNPYHNDTELLNWQIGALRNLPQDYMSFLAKLSESDEGQIDYQLENGNTYVYGLHIPAVDSVSNLLNGKESVLYISTPLEAVSSTIKILRIQLILVTIASLIIGLALAFFLSRKFSEPIMSISSQAKHMADGNYESNFKKGFCTEIDELADTLNKTSIQLKYAENSLKELLANISHDLRTPLTMIKGYAEMIRDISWENQEDRISDLEIIIRETDRLSTLVNDILEYSALQANMKPVEHSNIDISSLTHRVIKQFDLLCKRDGYTIEESIEQGQIIECNQEQIIRVLYNLIDNAIVHCGENHKIKVALKNLNGIVRIEVQDFGIGIPQNELSEIWERYFTSKQRNKNGRTSGLGLAIVKEILTAHKATFGAESHPGQGSTFWFEFKNNYKVL